MRKFMFIAAASLALFAMPVVNAQDPDYNVFVSDADGAPGDTVNLAFELDFADGAAIQGYQWGVCHDDAVLSLEDGDVLNGAAIETVSFTFQAISVFTDPGAAGWTVGALLNVITGATIAPADDQEMFTADYDIDAGTLEDSTVVEWCETLGTPAVTVRVIVSSDEIEPVSNDGTVSIAQVGGGGFTFFASDVSGEFDTTTGSGAEFSTTVSILEDGGPSESQGLQMGMSYDDSVIDIVVQDGDDMVVGALADLNGGDGPDFFGANFDPVGGPGFTLGVVYNLTGGEFIEFSSELDVYTIAFVPSADDLAGTDMEVTTELTWNDTLGDPVLPNSVVVGGDSVPAVGENGTVVLTPVTGLLPHINGDANDDGVVNNLDAFFLIDFQFQSGAAPNCDEAADANDDGVIDNLDTLLVLEYVYLAGAAPAAPFPACGVSGTSGASCDVFENCP